MSPFITMTLSLLKSMKNAQLERLQSHLPLTALVCQDTSSTILLALVSEMTYYVSSRTLNPTHSHSLTHGRCTTAHT